ncbi:uncharacterized protein TRUGW13939_06006 [Talaromyces rugulosus]|uniref:Uncharacterized protein n=1 Tax=Talaromyces rugulosus TaxID=121627 RepID=A0A7H8QYW3_TALRU|nr:uncharacterized protein TRUGW13939_06006 [Talaromyces rugulosus]QKX58878.1 hypothetical protein TRUGW13939_06006 [Talaromyces rugulosus]
MRKRGTDDRKAPQQRHEDPRRQPTAATSRSEACDKPGSVIDASMEEVLGARNTVTGATPHYPGNSQRRRDVQTRPERIKEANQLASEDEAANSDSDALRRLLKERDVEQQQLLRKLKRLRETQEDTVHDYGAALREREATIQELYNQIHSKSRAFDELQHSNAHLLQKLDEIQERVFRFMNKGGSTSQGDEKTRNDLLRLGDKMKAWARNNSSPAEQRIKELSIDQKQEIISDLSGYCLQHDWDDLMQMMPPKIVERITVLFVQAMLSKHVFCKFFSNPFFVLEGQEQTIFPASLQLFNLYQAIMEADETEAHVWRSQLIRLFQTSEKASQLDSPLGKALHGSLSRMAAQLREDFLQGPARYLLLTPSNERASQVRKMLEDIFYYAAQLALSLWTQRSFLKYQTLRDLSRFFNGRENVGAHALHRLDEEDTRLDGKQVLVVIQPALLAFGNDEAEYYDQHKVWAKAMVLIDER